MNAMDNLKYNKSYFAAANSFDGFKSLFDDIFDSNKFTNLFVLKGGPGTGKSSLMKVVAEYAISKKLHTELIFCSSDPNSLDGLIVESKSERIGILDGTSPHERDARLPGAFDSIINLAEALDSERLMQRKNIIAEINERKKDHYRRAYEFLKLAGNVWNLVLLESSVLIDYSKADSVCDRLSALVERGNCTNISSYYLSCFGKDGHKFIDSGDLLQKRKILINGNGITDSLVMTLLKDKLVEKNAVSLLIPSPLNESSLEKIVTENIVFEVSNKSPDIDTLSIMTKTTPDLNELLVMYSKVLLLAQNEFKKASDAHFELEKIYTASMRFQENDKKLTSLLGFIDKMTED